VSRIGRRIFLDEVEATLFLVAFSAIIFMSLYRTLSFGLAYDVFLEGDVLAHLYIPRVVVDNGENSGFALLGTVWLPLQHILMIPLVSIDILYTTGLAGTILNAFMVGGITCLIYRLAGSFGSSTLSGALASLIFLLAPYNLFVVGSSPWQPPTGVFFMLLGIYYFKQYLERDDTKAFMKCSGAMILGTLSRYETWPVAVLMAMIFALRELMRKRAYRIVYVNFLFWGVAYWLFYNLSIFRDPLIWLRMPWVPQYAPGESYYIAIINRMLTLSPKVFYDVLPGLVFVSGFAWIFALLALLLHVLRRNWSTLLSLLLINAPMLLLPASEVLMERAAIWKVYYFAIPSVILTAFSFPSHVFHSNAKRKFLAICFLVLVTSSCIPSFQLQYQEYVYGFRAHEAQELLNMKKGAEYLSGMIGGKNILASSSRTYSYSSYAISTLAGLSPSKIVDEYDGTLFKNASKGPWKYCEYVIINKGLTKADLEALNAYYNPHYLYLFYYDRPWRDEFLKHYQLIFETEYYMLYRRVD
jgi:hypothetical protein